MKSRIKMSAMVLTMCVAVCMGGFDASAARMRQETAILRGTVVEKATDEPLGWATVALVAPDSTIICGTTCSEAGKFELSAPAGPAKIRVSMIGYADYEQYLGVISGEVEVGEIALDAETRMLEGAMVSETVRLVEMKMDKLVMNVSQSAFAQGSNALELMKKAPGVTIDKDGNVKLNGKTVSVWIDGRPSYMDGKSLEALLRSTNSESIDKFEIMEHPSSKYDAAGQGGIINIKTKKNMLAGFNGSLGIGGGGMYFKDRYSPGRFPWQESFWLNLGLRTAKTNTTFSIYEGFYNTDFLIANSLKFNTAEGQTMNQLTESLFGNFYHNFNVKLSHDWFINDRNTLGAILYIPGDCSRFNSVYSTTSQSIDGLPLLFSDSDVRNRSKSIQYTANLNYTHIFDEARSAEMTVNLDYYHNDAEADNDQVDSTSIYKDEHVDQTLRSCKQLLNDNIYNIYSAKLDYQTILWKKVMLEAGAKWALSMTDNATRELSGSEELFPTLEHAFTYREHIAAAYFSMAGQFWQKLTAKVGLRGEYTNSFGDWEGAKPRSYFDLFPTVYLGFTPDQKWRVSASYSRRVNRPRYSQLDPTKTFVDSKTYMMGNPDLLPQYSDDVNLAVGFGQHLNLAVGYNHNSNMFLQLPSFEEDGTEYLTWGNFGVGHLGYASFSVSALPIAKWLQWTFNLNGLYTYSKPKNIEGAENFVNKGFAGQVYTSFSFILPKSWRIDLDGNCTTPMRFGLYRVDWMGMANVAVKKSLLDNRMTLSLRCDDIFRTGSNNLRVLDPTGKSDSFIRQKYYGQKIIFDLSWSFGKAQQTKARKVGNLEEMSRTGSQGLGK